MTSCRGPIGQPSLTLLNCVYSLPGAGCSKGLLRCWSSKFSFLFFFAGIAMFRMQKRGSFDNKSKGKT